jgi:hypothetical protein
MPTAVVMGRTLDVTTVVYSGVVIIQMERGTWAFDLQPAGLWALWQCQAMRRPK